MPSAFSTTSRARRARCSRAAPAPPLARTRRRSRSPRASCSGSMTSPVPEISSELLGVGRRSAAPRAGAASDPCASPWRARSRARVRLPCFCSFASKYSNSVNASAAPPAKPASTLPSCRRRTLRALPFMTWLPSVTWPSPPRASAAVAASALPETRRHPPVAMMETGEFTPLTRALDDADDSSWGRGAPAPGRLNDPRASAAALAGWRRTAATPWASRSSRALEEFGIARLREHHQPSRAGDPPLQLCTPDERIAWPKPPARARS